MDLSSPRCSRWKGLMLVASLLASGICQASGQIFITQLLGVEGYRSILALENVPENVQEYSWYRGTQDSAGNMILSYKPSNSWQPGPMHSGRESVTRAGDLVIKKSMLNDTGNYTVWVDTGNKTQTATGWLEIVELESNPGISVNATSLVENMDSVAAYCHTNVTKVTWFVNSVPISSSNRMTISPDGKTLIIHRVSRYDRTLQCVVESFPEIFQRSEQITLTVAYGPDSVVLRATPDIFKGIITAKIGSRVEMECVSISLPPSLYRWTHNGSLLNFSEAKMTLLSLAWEQLGWYRCIVENSVAQLTFYRNVRIQLPPEKLLPVARSGFYISESLVVFLIVVTVLGSVYLCGVLVYALVSYYSTRTSQTT
ncbi:carcinoembryonic antigen-related cell adhesion molecule 18 isoform X1 [Nycticebus coucang]|uniref:carcinoembryonic antigen-related cell adhesion molecule 18 isoform X1 n=1 Tax=Nycticebus coucang TaxID=9470 RepID=UPI00234D9907|nr:carcinoembryonic antigen-related cell adhesion molecule 18 isoform X1 [Nycticebus coucang]XP_053460414.1 carcinoembryonic antigen-related cell adhesion molecule 18 isoform X1 [Nycticebus coucang]